VLHHVAQELLHAALHLAVVAVVGQLPLKDELQDGRQLR
jgi:hypothetical protein